MDQIQTEHFVSGEMIFQEGETGNTIMIVFNAFRFDTSAAGFNYSDIWYTYSQNGGFTWSTPTNITNSGNQDARYPSISKYNAPSQVNIVFQQDPVPGSCAFTDGAPVSQNRQVFYRFTVPNSVRVGGGLTTEFGLYQNYPNPFNPSTTIRYELPHASRASLKVYNTLGQEVATLVNETRPAGVFTVQFDGGSLSSGLYFYRMRAGEYVQTKKLVVLK